MCGTSSIGGRFRARVYDGAGGGDLFSRNATAFKGKKDFIRSKSRVSKFTNCTGVPVEVNWPLFMQKLLTDQPLTVRENPCNSAGFATCSYVASDVHLRWSTRHESTT